MNMHEKRNTRGDFAPAEGPVQKEHFYDGGREGSGQASLRDRFANDGSSLEGVDEEVYAPAPIFSVPPLQALEFTAPKEDPRDDLAEHPSGPNATIVAQAHVPAESTISRLAHRFAPTSPPTIVSIFPEAGIRFELPADQTVVIGRDPRRSGLVLLNASVSQKHCQIVVDDEECTLIDLGSSNGTFVNGERVNSARILRQGDLVTIGRFVFIFLWYRFAPQAQPETLQYSDLRTLLARLYPTPSAVQTLLLASNLFNLPVDISKGTIEQVWERVLVGLKKQDFLPALNNMILCALHDHPDSSELRRVQETIRHWENTRHDRGIQERVNIDVKNSMLLVREILGHHEVESEAGPQELLEDVEPMLDLRSGVAPATPFDARARDAQKPSLAPPDLPFDLKMDESGAFKLPSQLSAPTLTEPVLPPRSSSLMAAEAPRTVEQPVTPPPIQTPSLPQDVGRDWFNKPSPPTVPDLKDIPPPSIPPLVASAAAAAMKTTSSKPAPVAAAPVSSAPIPPTPGMQTPLEHHDPLSHDPLSVEAARRSPSERALPSAAAFSTAVTATNLSLPASGSAGQMEPPPPVPRTSRGDLSTRDTLEDLALPPPPAVEAAKNPEAPWDNDAGASRRTRWLLPVVTAVLLGVGAMAAPWLFFGPATPSEVPEAGPVASGVAPANPVPEGPAPEGAAPAADVKPADPVETKPAEVPVADAKPAEVPPAEAKPAEVPPAEVKPAEAAPAQAPASTNNTAMTPVFSVINFLGKNELPVYTDATKPAGSTWDSKTNQITASSLKDCQWVDQKTATFASKGGKTFRLIRCSTGAGTAEGWVVEAGMKPQG